MSKLIEYFKETKIELKHVIWPTRSLTIFYTLIVISLSFLVAYYLGLFDFIFAKGIESILTGKNFFTLLFAGFSGH
ncbi:MAG: preprotein translocase subunit SecE [bacterium]